MINYNKLQKITNRDIFNRKWIYEIEDLGARIEEKTNYQFRVYLEGFVIDIYPSSRKYFDIRKKEWGQFKNPVSFLEKYIALNKEIKNEKNKL